MKHLTASAVIQMLESSISDRRSAKKQIHRHASVREIIAALQRTCASDVRQILCDVLGDRRAKSGIDALRSCLDDPTPEVRAAAVDALAKIGSTQAGEVLLEHFSRKEADNDVRKALAVALGAVRYRPAVPWLVDALTDKDASLRGCAAWSLGILKAVEAGEVLRNALSTEVDAYAAKRMQEALHAIEHSS